MSVKRTKSIKIRVTEEELLLLNNKKSEPQLAAWMRSVSLGERAKKQKSYSEIDPKFLAQIAKIGNNLNQIARQVNTNNLAALYEIGAIRKQLDELIKCTSNT
ncbi:MAG: MobC family plasmid mobilization relaxosome protein [Endozoicomonadaceae bacterium]|nr:MobC family plasmid mobilization relaxosome protein [Endozoicomonadaceae bacterium]